ncbi:MAG: hypothetical protein AB1589_27720 [Cyanobacteriota bacterium]
MQFLLQEIASFISLISKRANLTGRYYKYNLHIGIGDPVFEKTAETISRRQGVLDFGGKNFGFSTRLMGQAARKMSQLSNS